MVKGDAGARRRAALVRAGSKALTEDIFVFRAGPLVGWYFVAPRRVSTAEVLEHRVERPQLRGGRGLQRERCSAKLKVVFADGEEGIAQVNAFRVQESWLLEFAREVDPSRIVALEGARLAIAAKIRSRLGWNDEATELLQLISKFARVVQEITRAEIEGALKGKDAEFGRRQGDKQSADRAERVRWICTVVREQFRREDASAPDAAAWYMRYAAWLPLLPAPFGFPMLAVSEATVATFLKEGARDGLIKLKLNAKRKSANSHGA